MSILKWAGLACAVALLPVSAQALSVTNRDAGAQKLTIVEGDAQNETSIAPQQTLEGICNQGCVIQLPNGEEYQFEGTETVSIEDGVMYLDDQPQEQGSAQPEQQAQ